MRPRESNLDLALGCHSCHTTRRNDVKRHAYSVANTLQERRVRAPGGVQHVSGPRDVETGPDEVVVLSIGRDSEPWLSSFIDHHLALGAKHIFYLDNGSRDDSIARASRSPNVSVFRTALPFNRYEVGMRRWITRTFGHNRWSLYCDVDELFDYPHSDRLPLRGLLGYLREHGYTALTGQMLDLFSDRPFGELTSSPDDVLREKYRFYDLTDLVETHDVYWMRDAALDNAEIACLFGGIRKRFFGDDCLLLTKHPLVFADDTVGVYTYDGHFMTGARVADISAALLHFKYVASLPERVQRTVAEEWHNKSGALYGGLAGGLAGNPELCLRLPTARELGSIDELIAPGFLKVTPRYEAWVDRYQR